MFIQVLLEILIVLIGSCGLVIHSGLITGIPRRNFFRYYTNLSNLLVVMFFLARTVVRITGNYDGFFGKIVFSGLWFYSVTMTILLTFGIYHFVLAPSFKDAPPDSSEFKFSHSFSNYCVHYVVPLLSLLVWLIFAKRSELQYIWALIWLVIPLVYVFYAEIRGLKGDIIEGTDSAYPYDFMDAGKHGGLIVFRNCVLVTLVFAAAGALLLVIRKLI